MRRRWSAVFVPAVLGGLAVLSAPPALAHGASADGGRVSVPLLVGGGVATAGAVVLVARRGRPLAVGGLLAVGVVLFAASLLGSGGGDDRPDVHMLLVEPAPGARVPAGAPTTVRVSIAEGALATGPEDDGGHLHLYVDGKLQQMPYSTDAQVTLTPGPHTLTVEYVDSRHVSYRPPIQQTVEVTAS